MNALGCLLFKAACIAVVVPLSFLGAGCNQKPASKSKDFSKTHSVTVLLGEPRTEYGNGLQHLYFESDGRTTPATLDGVPCRYLKLEGAEVGYIYFIIDPSFKKGNVKNVGIDVEFLAEKAGTLGVQFDASRSRKIPNPAYAELNQTVQLTGSKTWETATFHIQGATLKNAQNSGSDFRLCVSPPDLYVRRVTVTREAKRALLTQSVSH